MPYNMTNLFVSFKFLFFTLCKNRYRYIFLLLLSFKYNQMFEYIIEWKVKSSGQCKNVESRYQVFLRKTHNWFVGQL